MKNFDRITGLTGKKAWRFVTCCKVSGLGGHKSPPVNPANPVNSV
jgi:hypothetical protein